MGTFGRHLQSPDGRRRSLVRAIVHGVAALCISARTMGATEFVTVAFQRTQAPMLPAGVNYASFGMVNVDESGRVFYKAGFYSGQQPGLCYTDSALVNPQFAYRDFNSAGGVPNAYIRPATHSVGRSGDVSFTTDLYSADLQTVIGRATYAGPANSIPIVTYSGKPAPGVAGASSSGGRSVISEEGHVAFIDELTFTGQTTTPASVWRVAPAGQAELITREGAPVPGLSAVFGFIQDDIWVSDLGVVGFRGQAIAGASGKHGLWDGRPGELRRVMFSGDPVPGRPGWVFSAPWQGGLTGGGDWIVRAVIQRGEPHLGELYGLWRVRPGENPVPEAIAVTGDPAPPSPGLPADLAFGTITAAQIGGSPSGRQAAFLAKLVGGGIDSTNDESLWQAEDGSAPKLLMREGTLAPESSDGARFGAPQRVFNTDAGISVFSASLTGVNVHGGTDYGFYYNLGDGVARKLLREGDALFVNGLDRVVTRIDAGDTGDMVLNNAGRFACTIRFADGNSGVFAFQIPEPTSGLTTGTLALLTLLHRRSRSRLTRKRSSSPD